MNSQPMTVRRAAAEDAAALSALSVDVQKLHADALPHMFKQPSGPDVAVEFMQTQLADPAATLLLLNIDGQDVGYAFVKLSERAESPFVFANRFLSLHHISIRPEMRGRGGGEALISAVKELAVEFGATRIDLDTWEFNTGAHRFFEGQGFELFTRKMWYFCS